MSEASAERGQKTSPGKIRVTEELRGMARWQKVAIGVASVLILAGIALTFVESGQSRPAGGGPLSGPASSFTGGPGQTGGTTTMSEEQAWSGGLFRLGFSFFAAFCVGFALRRFLSLMVFGLGLAFLLLFGLAWFELIVVDWQAIDGLFTGFFERVQQDFDRFQTFMTGSLPSAGLAALGLVAGFRKNR